MQNPMKQQQTWRIPFDARHHRSLLALVFWLTAYCFEFAASARESLRFWCGKTARTNNSLSITSVEGKIYPNIRHSSTSSAPSPEFFDPPPSTLSCTQNGVRANYFSHQNLQVTPTTKYSEELLLGFFVQNSQDSWNVVCSAFWAS